MGKKTNNTTAKAVKKAKAAQKTERKEKKKVHKSKNKYDSEDEDDQDLEAILEKVWDCLFILPERSVTLWALSRWERTGKRHILWSKR